MENYKLSIEDIDVLIKEITEGLIFAKDMMDQYRKERNALSYYKMHTSGKEEYKKLQYFKKLRVEMEEDIYHINSQNESIARFKEKHPNGAKIDTGQ